MNDTTSLVTDNSPARSHVLHKDPSRGTCLIGSGDLEGAETLSSHEAEHIEEFTVRSDNEGFVADSGVESSRVVESVAEARHKTG